MEEVIEAKVPPSRVWDAWERAHAVHGHATIQTGRKGEAKTGAKKGFKYEILSVVPGKSFSILWKTLFVKLVFHHKVAETKRGSEIRYSFEIRGPFAWPIRFLLGKKIQANLALVLKAIVKQLESA